MSKQSCKKRHSIGSLHIGVCMLLSVAAGGSIQAQLPISISSPLQGDGQNSSVTITDSAGNPIDEDDPRYKRIMSSLLEEGPSRPKIDKSIYDNISKITLSPSSATVGRDGAIGLKVTNMGHDSTPIDFAVEQAGAGKRSLAGWIKDLPQGVVLAPKESRAVTLHVTPPTDAAAGTYVADIVVYYKPTIKVDATTDLAGDALQRFYADTTARGFPKQAYVSTKVTYRYPVPKKPN